MSTSLHTQQVPCTLLLGVTGKSDQTQIWLDDHLSPELSLRAMPLVSKQLLEQSVAEANSLIDKVLLPATVILCQTS